MSDRPPQRRRLRRWLDATLRLAAAIVLCLLLLCVTLGVVTRALNDPLIWTDEVSRFLMVWLAVLGWLLASRQRVHIRIRYFLDLLPLSLRRPIELILQLAVALFGGLTLWFSRDLRQPQFRRRGDDAADRHVVHVPADRAGRAGDRAPGA